MVGGGGSVIYRGGGGGGMGSSVVPVRQHWPMNGWKVMSLLLYRLSLLELVLLFTRG